MKIFILIILSFILISLLGVVVWMNLAPGYFQYGTCGCSIGYFTDEQVGANRPNPQCNLLDCPLLTIPGTWLQKLELNLAKLDFNRGTKSVDPNESQPPSIPQGKTGAEGKFCGGIAANLPQFQCPSGYKCQLDGKYPDASGHCVKSGLLGF